jgi:hypothetical protein
MVDVEFRDPKFPQNDAASVSAWRRNGIAHRNAMCLDYLGSSSQ